MQVVVDSLLTTYDRKGKGKTVLLLHGWGDNSNTFTHLSAALDSQYEIVSLDLPGFGQTQTPPEVWDLDSYASFIKSFTDKLGIKHVYSIVGHSNGGALAIRGLAQGSLQADKLVLIAASGVRPVKTLRRLALMVIAKVGKVATFWLPSQKRQSLRKKLYGVAGSDMLVAPNLQATFKKTVRQDVQADAKQLTQPTLLIYGAKDRAVPLQDGKRYLQLITHSHLEILPEAEHFVHHNQAAKVEALIKEFLA